MESQEKKLSYAFEGCAPAATGAMKRFLRVLFYVFAALPNAGRSR